MMIDEFGQVAGWERMGVIISGELPWEGSLLQDPCVLVGADELAPFEMWYGAVHHIGYAKSVDGRTWVKATDPVMSRTLPTEAKYLNQPSVVHHRGVWHMTYFGADDESIGRIHYATSLSSSGPWVKHGPVLSATEEWEDRFLYNSSLMYDADAAVWKMWYTAGKIASAGGEPRYICYATASDPAGPWVKHPSNPIISPMEDGGWASLGIGGPNVSKLDDGSYEMQVTGWQSDYPSRGGRLTSPDGVGWRLTRDALRMDLGETGGPEDAMIYRQIMVRHDGHSYLYYNVKNNRAGWNETINMAVWKDSLPVVDPAKWTMTQGTGHPNGASFRVRPGSVVSLGNAAAGAPQTLQGNVLIATEDYEMRADVTPLSESSPLNGNVLIVRGTTLDSYYYGGIAGGPSEYVLGKVIDGVPTLLSSAVAALGIIPNVTHSLSLRVAGSRLELFDDGNLVLRADDASLRPASSYIGLQTSHHNGRAAFANVSVVLPV